MFIKIITEGVVLCLNKSQIEYVQFHDGVEEVTILMVSGNKYTLDTNEEVNAKSLFKIITNEK